MSPATPSGANEQEGVKFQSPHDGSELMLTPEKSIELQNTIGADIIMVRVDHVGAPRRGDGGGAEGWPSGGTASATGKRAQTNLGSNWTTS